MSNSEKILKTLSSLIEKKWLSLLYARDFYWRDQTTRKSASSHNQFADFVLSSSHLDFRPLRKLRHLGHPSFLTKSNHCHKAHYRESVLK